MSRTTLDLDDNLIAWAMTVTRAKTKTAVLELGLQELLARHARQQLIVSFGSEPRARATPRRRPPAFSNR